MNLGSYPQAAQADSETRGANVAASSCTTYRCNRHAVSRVVPANDATRTPINATATRAGYPDRLEEVGRPINKRPNLRAQPTCGGPGFVAGRSKRPGPCRADTSLDPLGPDDLIFQSSWLNRPATNVKSRPSHRTSPESNS